MMKNNKKLFKICKYKLIIKIVKLKNLWKSPFFLIKKQDSLKKIINYFRKINKNMKNKFNNYIL